MDMEKLYFLKINISFNFCLLKTYCFIEIHFSFHHFFHLFILLQKKSNQNRWTKLLFLLFDYFSLRIKYQQKEKKNNNTHQNYDCTNGKEIENFIYLNWKVKINFLIKVSIFYFFFSLWLLKIQIADEQWLQTTIYKIIIQISLDIKVSKKNS